MFTAFKRRFFKSFLYYNFFLFRALELINCIVVKNNSIIMICLEFNIGKPSFNFLSFHSNIDIRLRCTVPILDLVWPTNNRLFMHFLILFIKKSYHLPILDISLTCLTDTRVIIVIDCVITWFEFFLKFTSHFHKL
jgi:hypothetical protein